MNLFRFPLVPVCIVAVLALLLGHSAHAQPQINAFASTPDGTYELRDQIPVSITVNNTVPVSNDENNADAINAANTAYAVRITKVRLIGNDIYGNQVFISTTSYPAPPNVNDLGYGVPDTIGNLGPSQNLDYTFRITVPNDGTLHDMVSPGYSVEVTITWDLQGGGTVSLVRTTFSNSLISVMPNLQLPSVTYPARLDYRGGEVLRFNSFIRNSPTGDGTRQSRPMRSTASDQYRVETRLTVDPEFGGSNNDDFLLYYTDILGDLGLMAAPDAVSEIRVIRVFDTPEAVPTYGDPGEAGTERNYTPQPDDGYLDIGEVLNIEYDVLVPQNYPGIYFVAGMVDSLSQIDEPTGFSPGRESPPRDASALVNDNTFIDRAGTKFGIQSTDSPQVSIVSGTINPSTGQLTTASNSDSDLPSVSARGESVAFVSYATNLATDGTTTNGRRHIYVNQTNPSNGQVTTVIASQTSGGVLANGDSFNPMVSADGRFVVFESIANNLVANDTNGQTDIFVRDLLLNTTTRVSVSSAGLQANGSSFSPSISGNGRYVAFHSNARNLAASNTASQLWGSNLIYVVDRDTNNTNIYDQPGAIRTSMVSINAFNVPANALTYLARISGDGRFVAFVSHATNLALETSALGYASIYRMPLTVNGAPQPANLQIVSRATGGAGVVGNAASYEIAINGDGHHIAFTSYASNLVADDTNGVSDVFVRDFSNPATPTTVRVSTSAERAATGIITVLGAITPPADNIPADNVAPGDLVWFGIGPRAEFMFDGPPPNPAVGLWATDSRDNLAAAINAAGIDIFAEVSTPSTQTIPPLVPPVIPPGSTVSATSYNPSIFLISTTPGIIGNEPLFISPSMEATNMTGGGTQANDPAISVVGVPSGSNMPSIDVTGRFVAYRSVATNLDVFKNDPRDDDPLGIRPRSVLLEGERIRPLRNGSSNVYVHDRNFDERTTPGGQPIYDAPGNSTSVRISVNKFGYPTTGLINIPTSANNHAPSISGNGQFVAFSSDAENNGGILFGRNNQSPLDNNSFRDVYLYNRQIAVPPAVVDLYKKQTVALAPFTPVRFGQTRHITLNGAASSGLAVTYTSSNPAVARVNGNTLTIVGTGNTVITATQAGNPEWDSASQARMLTVLRGVQTINFPQPFRTITGAWLPRGAAAYSSAGLPIRYVSNNPRAVITRGNAILLRGRGIAVVTATQPGNRNWLPAKPVRRIVGIPQKARRR